MTSWFSFIIFRSGLIPVNPVWELTHCGYNVAGCLRMNRYGLLWTCLSCFVWQWSRSAVVCSCRASQALSVHSPSNSWSFLFSTIYTRDGGLGINAPMPPAQTAWCTVALPVLPGNHSLGDLLVWRSVMLLTQPPPITHTQSQAKYSTPALGCLSID